MINFYKNKKILITGATGFKGSWLCLWLKMLGANVYGVGLKPINKDDLFNKIELQKKIKYKFFDIRDINSLDLIFKKFKPTIVFHLAGQPIVTNSYLEPLYTFDVNIMGTANILELTKKYTFVKSAIFITSDKCYENKEQSTGYKETDEIGGKDPYSASKAAAEILIRSYRESFFKKKKITGIASTRAGNVIGGGDLTNARIVPDCIKSLIKNKKILIRNPNSNRPWQHVLEPLRGYLMLGMKLYKYPKKYSSAWNFGSDAKSATDVRKIANLIVETWGNGKLVFSKKKGVFEHNLLQLNINKSKKYLNWKPVYSVKKSVIETTNWYKYVFVNKKNAYEISKKQILEYMNDCKWN